MVIGNDELSLSQLIQLEDGALIEVTSSAYDARPISIRFAMRAANTVDGIASNIVWICNEILSSLGKVKPAKGEVSKAEIEIGFNLEPEGNVYIAQVANDASIKVKFTVEGGSSS